MYTFQKAHAVWGEHLTHEYNQFLGFHCQIQISDQKNITFAIAARNYYRLYINGDMIASGPARTAEHYCRVDEISISAMGTIDVAIEVASFSTPERYCNDCTLEPGMLIAEISDEKGNILTYTGDGNWKYAELLSRDSLVETMSHSREIIEVYHLDNTSFDWRQGKADMHAPIFLKEEITYLERRSPKSTYQPIPFQKLFDVCDIIPTNGNETDSNIELARIINPKWYAYLPEEKCFLKSLVNEKDMPFTGTYHKFRNHTAIDFTPGQHPSAFVWEIDRSEVGFIDFCTAVEKETVIDIINSDYLETNGSVKSNSYVTRYYLQPGSYHLTTFEPKLTKYIKMIFRTEGQVTFSAPLLLDYTYPATDECYFQCSDGDLNRIYDAAKRTMRLNTMDIFMDCPQRERAGWLCDSYFSSFGAWQLFGDLSVEKDFIENFMLTNPDNMWNAFFPEVYPSSKTDPANPGIRSWSFWLIAELADYYERSGDREFIEKCRERVSRFIEGMLSLRGKSGLLENMVCMFVDWSISNRSFCLEPISVPCNCLVVYILEKMAVLYQRADWKQTADEMRKIIEDMDTSVGIFGGGGDSAELKNGKLERGECATESGIALELWSGFHKNDKKYIREFVEKMGPAPILPANPNIGKANLFIGLMIRFDVLARLNEIETLIRDWKALYLPELNIGTETLFESLNDVSGCHGFNGATGALMTNKILGLGQPHQLTKSVVIEPHPCRLKWANGAAKCADGPIRLRWSADYEEHIFDMTLSLPEGWTYELKLPFELNGWTVQLNGVTIK